MLNIIIKNRNLIKIVKYGKIVFKFLNRHLYILSLISLIAKFRKSNTYLVLNWLIKIIVSINLLFVSGLFFTFTDLYTPLTSIITFYETIFAPYIEIIKIKTKLIYNLINNTNDSINNHLESVQTLNNKRMLISTVDQLIDLDDNNLLSDTDNSSFNARSLLIFASSCFLVYFLFYIPGFNPVSATDIAQYNWFNQGLIDVKITVRDIVINYLKDNNRGPGPGGADSSTNYPSYPSGSNIKLEDLRSSIPSPAESPDFTPVATRTISLPGLIEVTNSESLINASDVALSNKTPSLLSSVVDPQSIVGILLDKSIQTESKNKLIVKRFIQTGVQTDMNSSDMKVMSLAFQYEIITNMKYFKNIVLEELKTSKLLNSIQLLDDKDLE
jgi:hypothetical protein